MLMIIYHAFYTLGVIFGLDTALSIFRELRHIQPIIPISFIFISGICTQLSRSNLRRGLILLIPAFIINAVTIIADSYIAGIAIYFGVINLLSILMILYGLLGKYAEKLLPLPSMIICLVLFAVTWGIRYCYIGIFGIKLWDMPKILYSTSFLFPLGFANSSFVSSDYFPLLPWIFLFLAGAYFAVMVRRADKPIPDSLYTRHSRLFSAAGKYSLYIYIAHQPLIYAAAFAVLRKH